MVLVEGDLLDAQRENKSVARRVQGHSLGLMYG